MELRIYFAIVSGFFVCFQCERLKKMLNEKEKDGERGKI